jgi:hypothetical protein
VACGGETGELGCDDTDYYSCIECMPTVPWMNTCQDICT